MSAAVGFSFLLGFVTLRAAPTAYETLSSGKPMVDKFGIAVPLLGLVVAFVFAALSSRSGGWSRIGAGTTSRSSAGTGSALR